MYFHNLADILIDTINNPETNTAIIHDFGDNNIFRIEHQSNYSGLMARPDIYGNVSQKQGLFDIKVLAGNRYLRRHGLARVTHYALFQDLYDNSTWDNCYYIWTGESPFDLTNDVNEQQALLTLSLLMFEQELNWGNEYWQKWTWFNPPHKRPRDMILGVIRFIFGNNGDVDAYPYWNHAHTTPTFGGSFSSMPNEYKEYFTDISEWDAATPLFTGEYLDKFLILSQRFNDNPYFNINI